MYSDTLFVTDKIGLHLKVGDKVVIADSDDSLDLVLARVTNISNPSAIKVVDIKNKSRELDHKQLLSIAWLEEEMPELLIV